MSLLATHLLIEAVGCVLGRLQCAYNRREATDHLYSPEERREQALNQAVQEANKCIEELNKESTFRIRQVRMSIAQSTNGLL